MPSHLSSLRAVSCKHLYGFSYQVYIFSPISPPELQDHIQAPSGQRDLGAPKTLETQHSKAEPLFLLPPPNPLAGALIRMNGTTILGHSSQKLGSHLTFLLLLLTLLILQDPPILLSKSSPVCRLVCIPMSNVLTQMLLRAQLDHHQSVP